MAGSFFNRIVVGVIAAEIVGVVGQFTELVLDRFVITTVFGQIVV